jgi:hypothetical protein
MHKELAIESNGDVQFLAGKMHEDKIAGLQIRSSYGYAELQLFGGRARHADPRAAAYTTKPLQSNPPGAAPPNR